MNHDILHCLQTLKFEDADRLLAIEDARAVERIAEIRALRIDTLLLRNKWAEAQALALTFPEDHREAATTQISAHRAKYSSPLQSN